MTDDKPDEQLTAMERELTAIRSALCSTNETLKSIEKDLTAIAGTITRGPGSTH